MFLRKCSYILASALMLASTPLLADLIVNINQVDPYPPTACVQVGGTVTYAITVTNNGPTPLRGVVVDDTLTSDVNTPGICLKSVSPCGAECKEFCITTRPNGFHANTDQTLGVDQSFTFTVTYRICTDASSTLLTNTVIATGIDSCGALITSGNVTATSCVSGCALAVTVFPTVPTNVCSNGSVTFTAFVTGSCESNDQLTYQWLDSKGMQVGTNSPTFIVPASTIIECGLPCPSTWSVNVTDNFTNCTATGTSAGVCVVSCADLAITKTYRLNCDQIIFTITVTNNGPNTSFVTINDCLPDCLTPFQFTPLAGTYWNATVNNNCVVAVLTQSDGVTPACLPVGSSASIEIVTLKTGHCGKVLCNTATVTGAADVRFNPNPSQGTTTIRFKPKGKIC